MWCRDNKVKAATQDDAEYDVAARELAFEGKGQASDRTLTPEELAEKQRQVGAGSLGAGATHRLHPAHSVD